MSKKQLESPLDPLAMVQSLDVDVLESRVAEIESDIATYTAGRQRELDALRTLLKAARIVRDGKPPRKQREPKADKPKKPEGRLVEPTEDGMNRFGGRPSSEQRKELADKIEEYLVEAGAAQVPSIAERVRYSESVVTSTLVMFPDRFTKKHAGYW
jgi:hypothetical protein